MHVESRFLRWGIFFVLAGAIPLAVDQGWLSADTIGGAWRLWPLILIGIGIGVLLRRTPFQVAGGLVVSATLGLMFGALLAGGATGGLGFGCSPDRTGAAFGNQEGSLASGSSVSIEMSCGDVSVHAATGNGWRLTGRGPAPRVDAIASHLEIRSASRTFFLGGLGNDGESWDVTLPSDPLVALSATLNAGTSKLTLDGMHLDDLSMTTNAGKSTVDLSGATVRSLSYTLNAGSARVALPASSMTGSATVNAGELGLCIPAGAALRIEASSVLASNDYASHGLIQSGSTWTTPGYDGAAIKIDLSLSANAGSIRLDPSGGCR